MRAAASWLIDFNARVVAPARGRAPRGFCSFEKRRAAPGARSTYTRRLMAVITAGANFEGGGQRARPRPWGPAAFLVRGALYPRAEAIARAGYFRPERSQREPIVFLAGAERLTARM